MSHEDGENHLPGLIRSADPARFFAAQFIPEPQRVDILALYAFDLEMEKITRTTREAMAGEIRLQWWREVFHGERDAEASASPLAHIMLEITSAGSRPFCTGRRAVRLSGLYAHTLAPGFAPATDRSNRGAPASRPLSAAAYPPGGRYVGKPGPEFTIGGP